MSFLDFFVFFAEIRMLPRTTTNSAKRDASHADEAAVFRLLTLGSPSKGA